LNWTRLTILTWLTLVAATLPLSGRTLDAPAAETGHGTPACPAMPEAAGGRAASPVLLSAPNTDAWHAGAIGQVVPSAELSATASTSDAHDALHLATDDRSVPAEQRSEPRPLRAMLICLYPHAPPAR
jgi:hypothetical protein